MHYETLHLYEGLLWQRSVQRIVKLLLVSMASTVFYYFSCGADNDVVGWIAAILIFLTGVFYIVAGTCMHKTFQPK